jgi:hypothetical protein
VVDSEHLLAVFLVMQRRPLSGFLVSLCVLCCYKDFVSLLCSNEKGLPVWKKKIRSVAQAGIVFLRVFLFAGTGIVETKTEIIHMHSLAKEIAYIFLACIYSCENKRSLNK